MKMGREEFFQAVEERLAKGTPLLLALDGRCGSGKTTISQELESKFPCHVFHTDDFYLPFSDRTPEQMAKPGGHVDFSRLKEEILDPLRQGKEVALRPYSCRSGDFEETRILPYLPFQVLEGSYAHHPDLGAVDAWKVFLTCHPHVQGERLLAREGEEKYAAFVSTWIPREEAYFAAYGVEVASDLVVWT